MDVGLIKVPSSTKLSMRKANTIEIKHRMVCSNCEIEFRCPHTKEVSHEIKEGNTCSAFTNDALGCYYDRKAAKYEGVNK
jgi:hypothetical protein